MKHENSMILSRKAQYLQILYKLGKARKIFCDCMHCQYPLSKCYQEDQIKEDEIAERVARKGEKRRVCKVG